MNERIRARALELGFDDCRFATASPPDHVGAFQQWITDERHGEMAYLARNASKRINPKLVLQNAKTVITLATSYEMPGNGTGAVARYARFSDYHEVLGERLKRLTEDVTQWGGREARSLWYVDTGPVLEREFAHRSGIGFIGKHTNVISRRFGNWIFLAEILTTMELEPDAPEKNRCGSCVRCINACPTSAITAPFRLDARRCISYLTIELKGAIPEDLRPAIGNRIFGCDDCLAACPWNRFAREGNLMKSFARSDLSEPSLLNLLSLDDAEFKKLFAETPLLRTKRRGLLRNVCVALGNVGDSEALPSLRKAADNREPLVAEHARWAIEQIQTRPPIKRRPVSKLPVRVRSQ